MSEVNMPRLSDTMQEGTITRWLKKAGDVIKKGDILAEIETDKATMELEAYDAGTLEQILVQEGQTVPIGQAIATIGSGAAQTPTASSSKEEQAPAATQVTVKTQSQPQAAQTDNQQAPTAAQPTGQQTAATAEPVESNQDDTHVKASPLARRIAEEHHINLQEVHGTGTGGRIVRDDIEDFIAQGHDGHAQQTTTQAQPQAASQQAPAQAPQEPPVPVAPAGADSEAIPLSRTQTLIARRLTEAKQSIPHFYVSSEVDMTEALALRQTLNASAGEDGIKVSVNDLIVKACALALEKFPEVNSSFKDGQFLRHKHIHVGIAVDIPAGLVVPVIHDTNIKGVRSIAREARTLIEKAKANKLSPADLEGGTFSVSNLGMMDVTDFIAVINPPQAAILAISAAHKQFVPIDGQPVIRDLMAMTMSADHRILYGATVARFLQEVKRLLQNPYTLLG